MSLKYEPGSEPLHRTLRRLTKTGRVCTGMVTNPGRLYTSQIYPGEYIFLAEPGNELLYNWVLTILLTHFCGNFRIFVVIFKEKHDKKPDSDRKLMSTDLNGCFVKNGEWH